MALTPPGRIFVSIMVSMIDIRWAESKMRRPEVCQPVAETLARYCQSDRTLFPEFMDAAWLPAEMDGIGCPTVRIRDDGASVKMGGGFYHYGYSLSLDAARSGQDRNVWVLSAYAEDEFRGSLTEVTLPKSARFTKQELVARVAAGYDRLLAASPEDKFLFKEKVMFLLRMGATEQAKETCLAWTKARPQAWLPQFALAHLRSRLGGTEAAGRDFTAWVAGHEGFENELSLFLFHMREGQSPPALAAIRRSLVQPFVEAPEGEVSKFLLGYNAALFAINQGEGDLALDLCDMMLARSQEQPKWCGRLHKARAASLFLKGEKAAAVEAMGRAYATTGLSLPGTHDFRRDDALRDAINHDDRAVVQAVETWNDPCDHWFDPLATEEGGTHGMQDRVSPYPKN